MEKTGPSVGDSLNKRGIDRGSYRYSLLNKCTTDYFLCISEYPCLFAEQQREPFKKRWFILDGLDRKLLYFKTELVGQDEI